MRPTWILASVLSLSIYGLAGASLLQRVHRHGYLLGRLAVHQDEMTHATLFRMKRFRCTSEESESLPLPDFQGLAVPSRFRSL